MSTGLEITLVICGTIILVCVISVILDTVNKRRNIKYMKDVLRMMEEEEKDAD